MDAADATWVSALTLFITLLFGLLNKIADWKKGEEIQSLKNQNANQALQMQSQSLQLDSVQRELTMAKQSHLEAREQLKECKEKHDQHSVEMQEIRDQSATQINEMRAELEEYQRLIEASLKLKTDKPT